MNNIGLRNYSKNLIRDLPYGKAYINLCPAETNLIVVIPLIEEMGIDYIFNYLSKNENGTISKGGHVSLFRRIDSNNRVQNSDFSIDQYTSGVENKDTRMTLNKSPIDRYGLAYTYSLTDKNKNVVRYRDPFRDYPYEMVDSKNKKTTITQSSSAIIAAIDNYSSVLTRSNDGTINKIEFKHKGKILKTVVITKLNNQSLRFEYQSPRGGVNTFEFKFSDNEVELNNLLSAVGEKYLFENSKLREIYTIDHGRIKKQAELLFDATNNITTITDASNKQEHFFFERRLIDGKYYYFNSLYVNDKGEVNSTYLDNEFKTVYQFGYDNIALNSAVIKGQCVDIDDGNCEQYQNKTELEDNLFGLIDVCNPLTMDWSFNVSALGSDALTLSCFVKALNNQCEVTAELNESKQTIQVSNNWKLLCVRLDVKKTIERINVKFNSNAAVLITPFNVFKDSFANIYKYNGDDATSQDLLDGVASGNGTKYNFRYNKDNELISFVGPHGVRVSYDYTNHKITRECVDSECWSLDSYTYYENDLVSHKHDGLYYIDYEYDNFEAIKTVRDALSCVDIEARNEYGNITKLLLKDVQNEEDSTSATYTYDSNQRLTSATAQNGSKYTFFYDDCSRMTQVSLNGKCIFKYTYNENDQIVRQYFGDNSDYYEFEYVDGKNVISRISHSSGSVHYGYEYDEFDRLVEVNETRNGVTKILNSYIYDSKGAHVKTINDTKDLTKVFDNSSNVIRSIDTFNQKTLIQEFDVPGRSKSTSPESILNELSEINGYSLATYLGAYDCSGPNNNYQCFTLINNLSNRPGKNYNVNSVSSNHRLFYELGRNWSSGVVKETFAFWFRSPKHHDCACLFKIDGKNSNSGIAIYERTNHFELVKVDKNANRTTLLSTNTSLHYSTNDWNFISISINIDPANNLNRCEIRVNSKLYVVNDKLTNISSLVSGDVQVRLGYNLKGEADSSEFCDAFQTCYFTIFGIWDPDTTNTDTTDFYKSTKDYLEDNVVIDYSGVDYSVARLIKDTNTNYGSFKVFPLDNNFLSLDYDPLNESDEDKPYELEVRDGYKIDGDRFFNFNEHLKRYAFVADGNKLSFRVNMEQKGTIAASFFLGNPNDKQVLFDTRGTGTRLTLYRNINGQAIVVLNGYPLLNSNAKIDSGWHNVAITFDATNGSQLNALVIIDGISYTYSFSSSTQIAIEEIMLGRSFYSETDNGGYQTNRPLYGQIANFAYCNINSSLNTVVNYFTNIAGILKIQMYDELGVIRKEDINKGNIKIFEKSINYRNVGPQVTNEYYRFANESDNFERSYSFDNAGNVVGISQYGQDNRELWYKYDYRGFLIEESSTDPDWTITYTYDGNGNILTRTHGPRYEVCGYGFPPPTRPTSDRPVETDTFVYDSQCPDKLIRFNDKQIEYDRTSPGNIVSIGTLGHKKTFKYEGRRLVQVTFNETPSIEIKITFEYNDKGLRTSKTTASYLVRFNKQTFQTTYTKIAESVFKYEYDGNYLVYEKSNKEGEIFYLYDEAKQLYGYILNGSKYFYIKDFLHNVLGVVDENGEIVAKYNYDAYGNLLSEEGQIYNPIRYKGYYFDSELNMFYCQSRYYVPELCRWLNMDNPTFLKYDSAIGMNLFAYCNNNPVMGIDPDGHIAFFVITLIIGAVIGAAVAYSNAKANGATGWDLALQTLGGAVVGGLIGAAVGAGIAAAAAGSFTASTAAVGKGIATIYSIGKAVAATHGIASGLAAAGWQIVDNISNAIGYVPHVFWSGGDPAKNAAGNLAVDVGGKSLEGTWTGFYLTSINYSTQGPAWTYASEMFATQVPTGGLAYAVQISQGVRLASTWATVEYPILAQKAVKILFEILGLM